MLAPRHILAMHTWSPGGEHCQSLKLLKTFSVDRHSISLDACKISRSTNHKVDFLPAKKREQKTCESAICLTLGLHSPGTCDVVVNNLDLIQRVHSLFGSYDNGQILILGTLKAHN